MISRAGRCALRLLVVLAVTLVVVPASTVRPATISLHGVETAKGVDFSDGTLWVLVLGADSEGRTDAIQLVGIDAVTGSAVGIGIPRDTWLDMPEIGLARINEAYRDAEDGPALVSRVVGDLTGVTPDLVLHLDADGFESLLGTLGPVDVRTPQAFETGGLVVERGRNTFGPQEALAYVRYREGLQRYDFDRSANQQRLMLGALTALRAQEDGVGFMEDAALAALGAVETNLGPTEIYRLAQFLTTAEPTRVDTCVVPGTFDTTEGGAEVVIVDPTVARRIGDDAADDLRLQSGCPGT